MYPEIPLELITIVSVSNRNANIIHDYPPYVDINDKEVFELKAYRDWDVEMERFKNNKLDPLSDSQNDPYSNSQNDPYSNSQNDPLSDSQKLNSISILNNTIIELDNNITESNNDIDRKSVV